MESASLKILFIGGDEPFARTVAEMLGGANELVTAPAMDAALAGLSGNAFHAILFALPAADKDGLLQVGLLSVKKPRLPIIVLGPASDEAFAAEIVRAGAQDYLVRDEIEAHRLRRDIRCAMERQHERNALIEEKDNYYGVFDHLVEGVFRTTPDGHYLLANIALAKIYGYESPVELMASITDIAHRLYVEPGRREEFVQLMQANDTITGFESKIYRKDETIIWISENCRAVRDAQGNILYYEGTVEDITERKHAEEQILRTTAELSRSREELRASEALYHSLVETMPQNIFRKDLLGRYTFANRQFCKTLGKSYEEVIGKTIADFLRPDAAALRTEDDQRTITSGKPFETVEQSIFSSEPAYIQVVKIPIFDANGKVTGIQGMFWDITEQKLAAEKIRQANAELSRSREELRAKNQLMEDNLHMAREIQLTMLPQQYPVFPKNVPAEQSAFQFTHRYQPAEAVSGDFFSVTQISDAEVGVFICDVAGHGVRAALVTAMIRALAEELKPLAREPGYFLRKLNSDLSNILKSTGSPMLTTAFYFVANWQTGAVRFANAGHPKPLVLRRSQNRIEPLANECGHGQPALGLFEEPPYETSEAVLNPGDLVMLFTDGLYEVQGANEELYSQQRLLVDMQSHFGEPAGKLFDHLLATIRAFSTDRQFEDDVCLVGMEFAGKPAQKKS